MHPIPVPHLITAQHGPLKPIEEVILNQVCTIEAWFRKRWLETPAPLTSSVDLRHAGFKIAPVDTNLFPAGFNNLNKDMLPLCVQAMQTVINDMKPQCMRILLLPENHTRNQFYLQSLSILRDILTHAGYEVRIGSLDEAVTTPFEITTETGHLLRFEPLIKKQNSLAVTGFEPCLIVLNNDLSTGLPDILKNITQDILPTEKLGWDTRLKSSHFQHFANVAQEFANVLEVDPWVFNPLFTAVDEVDFMAQSGLEIIAAKVDALLASIAAKYTQYDIKEPPFVVVKADNGTYGMSVMSIKEGSELLQLNRKQRTRMSSSKGSRKVTRVIIQEGVYTFETMASGAVAEPVVYMIGPYVVGGFYRVHQDRSFTDNLNAPGMHFEPLAFAQACNMPHKELKAQDCPNRFYVYGVIARLAALAAARELAAVQSLGGV